MSEEDDMDETLSRLEEAVRCGACRALNQHETANCPYALHRVHGHVAEIRTLSRWQRTTTPLATNHDGSLVHNPTDPEFRILWLLNELDRWAARWMAARDATIAAQYRAAEAIEIRLVTDADGCDSCAHYLERISTCMGPKLQQARQLDAGVYVPPWCPGFKAKNGD